MKDVTLSMCQDAPTVICGENNIGKTNFLRALNLFFNHLSDTAFSPGEDLPYHILHGSGGAGAKTELIGKFQYGSEQKDIKIIFEKDGNIQYKTYNFDFQISFLESQVLNNFE